MNYTSDEIKSTVAGYFRYVHQCQVVAFEASDKLTWASGEPADVLVVSGRRMLYEVEVKISIADLNHDKKKAKHRYFAKQPSEYPVNMFYFAVPKDLEGKAAEICDKQYPYAGLLSVKKFPFNSGAADFGVRVVKQPQTLSSRRLSVKEVMFLVKEQTGTLCRLARDKALLEKNYKKATCDNLELEKLLKLANISH